ncbi:MAG: hypothetical protein HY788_04465 [Deltaproteobacteria bacterium]|nr:hypothetical protein [Deltaproteobacteria bacterium]
MMYLKRIFPAVAVVALVLSLSGVGAFALDVKVRPSEPTGFKLVNAHTNEGSRGYLILEAGIQNTTQQAVENVLVFIVAKGLDGKEVNRVYTIVDPPLPLKPGDIGNVRISILTWRIPLSVIEYKVVGLL